MHLGPTDREMGMWSTVKWREVTHATHGRSQTVRCAWAHGNGFHDRMRSATALALSGRLAQRGPQHLLHQSKHWQEGILLNELK